MDVIVNCVGLWRFNKFEMETFYEWMTAICLVLDAWYLWFGALCAVDSGQCKHNINKKWKENWKLWNEKFVEKPTRPM